MRDQMITALAHLMAANRAVSLDEMPAPLRAWLDSLRMTDHADVIHAASVLADRYVTVHREEHLRAAIRMGGGR